MGMALTQLFIDKIKPGPARREVPDGQLRGLFLIVQPTGKMAWAVRYRHYGRPRKLTLGAYPGIGLKDARAAATLYPRLPMAGMWRQKSKSRRPQRGQQDANQAMQSKESLTISLHFTPVRIRATGRNPSGCWFSSPRHGKAAGWPKSTRPTSPELSKRDFRDRARSIPCRQLLNGAQ